MIVEYYLLGFVRDEYINSFEFSYNGIQSNGLKDFSKLEIIDRDFIINNGVLEPDLYLNEKAVFRTKKSAFNFLENIIHIYDYVHIFPICCNENDPNVLRLLKLDQVFE